MKVICDYCGKEARLVSGKELYPHRSDLFHIMAWECKPCKASVGCHKNSPKNFPLGRLANAELKKLKMEAHAEFDPLWKTRVMRRKEAYQRLAQELDIDFHACHIGMFNEDLCKRTIEACIKIKKELWPTSN